MSTAWSATERAEATCGAMCSPGVSTVCDADEPGTPLLVDELGVRIGGDSLDRLQAAVDHLRANPPTHRTPEELGDDLRRLRHTIDLLELEFADRSARFAATNEFEAQGAVSPVSWIRHHCRMSGHDAAGAVRVGEQQAAIPRTTAALKDGQIGFAHLALLASTAELVRESSSGGHFDEGPLLRKAMAHTVTRFRNDCAHARHAADAAAFLAEQVGSAEGRRLRLLPCGDGALVVRGILDAIGGAALRSALEPLARPTGPDDHRERDLRLADALVELAGHGLDHCGDDRPSSRRPHLQVTTSLETLVGLAGAPAGEMEFAGPVAAATVQRIGCDAAIRRILLGPDAAVVDVGRARRVPASATRQALRLRDRGCAWPGCDRPASWTEAHHLQHWAHGGETDLENLALLCGRHHWLCHEGGWQLVRTPGGAFSSLPPLPDYRPPSRAPASG